MELDDLKKAWNKLNDEQGAPLYSENEIADFRRARSRDFSVWIQNGLIIDIILKSIFSIAFLSLIVLLRDSFVYILVASVIIALCIILIIIESRYLRRARKVDQDDNSVTDSIKAKLSFLRTYYYRVQFLQGLTNPIFVAAGISFFYYFKYGRINITDYQDIILISIILLISFLLTLPTTFSLYGYHYSVLKSSLARLEDERSWQEAIKKYKKQRKVLYWFLGILLLTGVIILIYLMLL